ncbi:MAG: acyl-CoA dehydrogenase [Planctomycetaceae bacterium]|nr:acyl-CoA dehydrogenase [Planctomycetaceae bacterium]
MPELQTESEKKPATAASSQPQGESPASENEQSFVETALKLSGKSEEEARSTGAVDKADEQVEALFAPKYQTSGSPAHLAVWSDNLDANVFYAKDTTPDPDVRKVMDDSLNAIRTRRENGTLLDENKKISDESLAALGEAGYWGLLVDKEFGGQGSSFVDFAKFLTQMATVDPTVAGLASVHGCIGAVDPLRAFGNADQKLRYLPKLASGERLSAFALTEPCAGSDLTALKTEAKLDGAHYVVNGEKLFITNAVPGRTVGLVCLIEGKPAVLIADLPDEENENFQVVKYGLYALRQSYNNGLKFKDFKVPRENLLEPSRGDGLTIAYHGLNRGRVALCANAAGTMRVMLASMLPWAEFRRTYGASIVKRELVQRRIGRMSALIVACDALVEWCAWLLDEGYRGEMECIVAKIFGSEAQKEAAIELYMKTHGGRAFLEGHLFGDYVHEFLAPCIYEGEGEMLGMAFFKSLIKEHGKKFFEPIGYALQAAGIKKPNPLNPAHAWALKGPLLNYSKWRASQVFASGSMNLPNLPSNLREHAEFAAKALRKSRLQIDSLMTKHQLGLADRQCEMAALSLRIQSMVVMLTTCMFAGKSDDGIVHLAADVMCQDLRREITGELPNGKYYKTVTKLGAEVANGGFSALTGVEAPEILMKYES